MSQNNSPIIGIGASAGGLEALELFFNQVDNNAGYAYVVIQHLAPNHKSLMDELLARHTTLPIKVIEDGMPVQVNTIYLNPPKKFVSVSNGKLKLNEKEDRKLSFPITTFFQSLAEEQKENCAAIILSGTGSDGSEGIKFIKEKGGIVLVQTPESAKFDGMPKNAIHTNCVDKVCVVENMHEEIKVFFNSHKKLSLIDFQTEKNTEQIKNILKEVNKKTLIDFSGYKFSTMYRRTIRRMGLQGFKNLDDYTHYIQTHSNEAPLLAKELLIGVTRFFRDGETFEVLMDQVIPKLVEQNSETKNIRVWVPACSSGEEAYSIAILIKDYLKKNSLQYDVKIFATDLDVDAIKVASNQIFPESISNEINPYLLNAYFIRQKEGFKVAKEIRDMIVFSVHNVIQDPPFSKIDLLSCRNFLIYLESPIQQKLFSLFRFTLVQNGFLLLGASESLGETLKDFTEFDKKHKIYINKINIKVLKTNGQNTNENTIRMKRMASSYKSSSQEIESPKSTKRVLESIHEHLIQQYVPDAVVFNDYFELIHTTGNTNKWLRLPIGEVSINIIRMLPEEFRLPFELASNKLMSEHNSINLKNVEIPKEMMDIYDSKFININLRILDVSHSPLYIALFESPKIKPDKRKIREASDIDLDLASKEKIGLLERELIVNKENLQTTIEELESSNEELQASNEELQSSNEELESVNEELYTVNAEFQEKVEELTITNNDLNHLIQSTDIAILFLDTELKIRKFTPAIKEILNLENSDIGRHISHFKSHIQLEKYAHEIEEVHRNLQPFETTIQDRFERKFMVRISPFRTVKNEIKGVVISFIEITAFAQAKEDLKFSKRALDQVNLKYDTQLELFEIITNNSKDLIALHNVEGAFEYVSPSAINISGLNQTELIGIHPFDFIKIKSEQKIWKEAFEKVKSGKQVGLIQLKIINNKKQKKWIEVSFKPVEDPSDNINKILATYTDVSDRIYFEEELHKLSLIAKQTKNSVIITDLGGRITYVNQSFLKLTGYDESFVMGKKPGKFLQGKETNPKTVKIMRDAIEAKKGFQVDILNYSKIGYKYWTTITCEPLFDQHGETIGFFSIQYEISHQKEYEDQIESLNELLKSRNNKLSELNKSLEEFAYVASHDLKEPARNIKSMLELILRKSENSLDKKLMNYMQMAAGAGDKMNQMINSLLEYSRSGVLNEELKTITIKELAEEVEFSLQKLIKENNTDIIINDEIGSFKAYPILFGRLLQNLIQNAIKYRSKQNPEIKINTAENELYYLFSVADNGIGISERNFDRVFKIFQKLHDGDPNSYGIGLAICKKIVETHLGEIKIESQEGLGTTIHFSISKQLEN
ncbi:two-component system, chemotaxis family, CheB/CheR fusion protein [Marivirga sericea]|uniref:histidine kinase n=1 Tax=Marivirga sericea TaxID=1028 RepID=A0A1X7KEV3_9BACT|nr:chemotaxis protein CheB [Marivirga sericea]SMG39058.1 two-component system, chemotaxis family, CheB/CheR fusion protein [Marivirga sericea]